MPLIVEGLLTTRSASGFINLSPMGPIVGSDWSTLLLRPFPTSKTFANLKQSGQGVFHVTDDVRLIARAAIENVAPVPPTKRATIVDGDFLVDACRHYEFRVDSIDESRQRVHIECTIVHVGRHRDFLGFNRAKHAVIEAAILATRRHLLDEDIIRDEWRRLETMVTKTSGPEEVEAFQILTRYLESYWSHREEPSPGA